MLGGASSAAKMGAKMLAPGPAPSHAISPATREAMAQQRSGERSDFAAPSTDFSPAMQQGLRGIGGGPTSNLGAEDILSANLPFSTQPGGGLDVGSGAPGPGSSLPPSGGMNIGNTLGGVSGALGGAAGAYGAYQGIQSGNPMQAALGAGSTIQGVSGLSGALGGPTLGSLAGTAGSVAGPALGALGGAYGLYKGIENEQPVEIAAGALGAAGGAASAASAAGLAGAGVGAIGGAATGIGAVLAVGIIVNQLVQMGILPGNYKPTSADISRLAGTTAAQRLASSLPKNLTLPQMSAVLSNKWSPNNELSISSTGAASPEEFQNVVDTLRNPQAVAQGQSSIDPFVRGLGIKYGQTGDLNRSDPETTWRMQNQIAMGLPDLPAYQALKADLAPGSATESGGSMWQAEQARLGSHLSELSQAPTQYVKGQDQTARNQYDPYTGTVTRPDGRQFQLTRQAIEDYGMNPYTYDPDIATYGAPQRELTQAEREGGLALPGHFPSNSGEQTSGSGLDMSSYYLPQFRPEAQIPQNLPQVNVGNMQPFDMSPFTGGMSAGVPEAPTGSMDPGVSVGGAGKRSPSFITPEIDNRAEADPGVSVGGAGKLGQQSGAADTGVPFGMAGKRPGGGMGVQAGGRPQRGGAPAAPFGGMPRGGGMMPGGGGRPGQQRRPNQGVV